MQKLRKEGGIKLINTKLKSETPKIYWLIKLINDDTLKVHFHIFNSIIGNQHGHITGRNIIFVEHSYIKKHLKINNPFYQEALEGISKLNTWKHIPDINEEHLFYNPVFTTTIGEEIGDRTLNPFRGNRLLQNIKTYGDLLRAEKEIGSAKLKAVICRMRESIENIRESVEEDQIIGATREKQDFKTINQKFIYSELIHQQSTDHIYQTKWILEQKVGRLEWDKIWDNIHQQFFTEEVKSTIWDQIHLNFYTTYNYNKWHNVLQPCPLCKKIPDDIFHIMIDCTFTKKIWKKIENTLLKIVPKQPTVYEKAFGLQPTSKKETHATILRNWITFTLRYRITLEERKAYHKHHEKNDEQKFISDFNYNIQQEVKIKGQQYLTQGLQGKFERIMTAGNGIAWKINNNEFKMGNIME